jgi:hypothetical protein
VWSGAGSNCRPSAFQANPVHQAIQERAGRLPVFRHRGRIFSLSRIICDRKRRVTARRVTAGMMIAAAIMWPQASVTSVAAVACAVSGPVTAAQAKLVRRDQATGLPAFTDGPYQETKEYIASTPSSA